MRLNYISRPAACEAHLGNVGYKARGIHPLLYLQLAGDGYRQYVEEKFPESIAHTIHGDRMGVDHYNTWLMNSDPALPFGKHIAGHPDRFFELYPEASGLFWDQPCYDSIDAAHHDGITMVYNKPAYRLAFCYDTHRDPMVTEAHRRGMFVSSNSPVYIELAQKLDQIMAEALTSADNVQYLCLERPMIIFSLASNSAEAEFIFQTCLLTGATCPQASSGPLDSEIEEVFFAYLPLLVPLKGRRWVLEANPLELPSGTAGNIFRRPDGKTCVTLVSRLPRLPSLTGSRQPITFETKFHGVEEVKAAAYVTLKTDGWREAEFKIENGRAKITLPEHCVASTVVID